jgi:hypothetical protein
MLPIDEAQIETLRMNYIGLGKSIYMKKQLDEFFCVPGQPRYKESLFGRGSRDGLPWKE